MVKRRNKRGSALGNMTLTLATIFVFLALAEAASWMVNPPPKPGLPRDMFEFDPKGYWRMTLNFTGVMDNRVDFTKATVTADSVGNRIVPEAPSNTSQRLLVLGDSQAFGHGLSDADSWPNRLQEDLNRRKVDVAVSNLAVPAINIDQYLARIRAIASTLGATDTVLVALSWNDVITPPSDKQSNQIVEGYLVNSDGKTDEAALKARIRIYDFSGILIPQFQDIKTTLDTLSQTSALVATLYPRAKAIYYRTRSHSPVSDLVKAGVPEANFLMIRQIADIVSARGARLVLTLLPERMFFDDALFATYSVQGRDFPTADYQAALALPQCQSLGIRCLNAFPLLHEHQAEGLVFPVDGHYNPKGAALLGPWLAREIFPSP